MKHFENLSQVEQQTIRDLIQFQNFLDETADLEYQAYVNKEDYLDLYFNLLEKYGKRCIS